MHAMAAQQASIRTWRLTLSARTVPLEIIQQHLHHFVHRASRGRTHLLMGPPTIAQVVLLESIQQLKVPRLLMFASTVQGCM